MEIQDAQQTKQIQQANLNRVIYIALCFMFLFTAYSSAQNLAGQMYRQLGYGSLGQICLFTVFGTSSVISFISTHLKSKMTLKFGLVSGALAYSSFSFSGAVTSYCYKEDNHSGFCEFTVIYALNIGAAALVGLGGATIWIFQSTYVNACANEEVKGFFNGLFLSIYQCANMTGSLLAATILANTNQFTFYLILGMFVLSSIGMSSFVKSPLNYGIPTHVDTSTKSLQEAVSSFLKIVKDKKYRFFFIGIVHSGIAIGCLIAYLGTIVAITVDSEDNNLVNKSIGYTFFILSIGLVCAGLTMGKLADRFDKVRLFNLIMIMHEAALTLAILACIFKSYGCAILCGLVWGYADAAIQTMIGAVIGSLFDGKTDVFSAYRFFQRQGLMCSCIVAAIIPRNSPIVYLMIIAATLLVLHILFF